ncbi:MAG: hypothetical protein CMJ64_22715 [Planctomycetaceae bacterium]|nr:hypothetical protein [Planctomycetaceae bacterium]
MNADTVLIVGGDSTLGRALASRLSSLGARVITTTRRAKGSRETRLLLDLASESDETLPDCSRAFLCAGITSQRACEEQPGLARRVNVEGTVRIAERLVERGSFVVFPSTNLVFSGDRPFARTDATLCPRTEYGRLKTDAEARISALGPLVAVVRLSKLLTPDFALFDGWYKRLAQGQSIEAFRDMRVAPVTLATAASTLATIGRQRISAVSHLSGDQDVSYYDVAQRLASRMTVPAGLVKGVTTSEVTQPARAIPRHTTLDCSRLVEELGMSVPSTWSAIDAVIDSIARQERDD